MAQDPNFPEIDPSVGEQMFAELDARTTEQVVAEIAAANPHKHDTPVEERKRRARARAAPIDISSFAVEDQLIIAAGGDPNEMMPGNKPRWTVADEADANGSRTVKDHLTGLEFGQIAVQEPTATPEQADMLVGESTVVNDSSNPSGSASLDAEIARFAEQLDEVRTSVVDDVRRSVCDHKFGEPLDDDSKCKLCGLTFGEWANS